MIMKDFLAICLLFIFYSCGRAHQTHGLCSQFYQKYQHCTNNSPKVGSVSTNHVKSEIKKKAPKGDCKSSEVVNCTAINLRIDGKIKNLMKTFVNETRKDEEVQNEALNEINEKISSVSLTLENMANRIQRMEKTYTELLTKLDLSANQARMKNKTRGVCPISYNDKCFVPVMDKKVTLDEARNICAEMAGKLADIYNMDQFDLIVRQIRANRMNGKSIVWLRLGMTLQPSTGQVSLTDGTKVTYLKKWFPGFPSKSSTRTSVILRVMSSTTAISQYLFNATPTYKYSLLCEI